MYLLAMERGDGERKREREKKRDSKHLKRLDGVSEYLYVNHTISDVEHPSQRPHL
jgi:hypothetical protein